MTFEDGGPKTNFFSHRFDDVCRLGFPDVLDMFPSYLLSLLAKRAHDTRVWVSRDHGIVGTTPRTDMSAS